MTDPADLRPVIRRLAAQSNLTEIEIERTFDSILAGSAGDASTAAFLVALTMKGVTAPEVKAVLATIRRHATRITPDVKGSVIDTCGTGGDSMRTFNISTASAIVASAAGAIVAKHGNRSVSGVCGSADLLEHLGLDLETPPAKVQQCIERIGIGFLFAPVFHPSMKNVAKVRKEIGIRTVFNMIGPLSNPCTNLLGQVIGVFEPAIMELLAEAYQDYIKDVMIVHAADGFDEFSNTCENDVIRITRGGQPQRFRIHPKVLNIQLAKPEALAVSSRNESIRATLRVIYGKAEREKEDVVVMNASAALLVANVTDDLKDGIQVARAAIRNGSAKEKLSHLIDFCGDVHKLRDAEREFL